MRVDKIKNTKKVFDEIIKEPLQTQREISEKTWVSKSAVDRAMKEMGQIGAKDDKIIKLTDEDFDLMISIQKEKKRRLDEEKDKINNSDIDRWEQTATKRYSLFRWNITNSEWWIQSLSDLSDLELLKLIENDN